MAKKEGANSVGRKFPGSLSSEDLHTWMVIMGQAVLLGGVDSNFFFLNFVIVVVNCIYHQTKNLHGATMMCSALCVSAAKS